MILNVWKERHTRMTLTLDSSKLFPYGQVIILNSPERPHTRMTRLWKSSDEASYAYDVRFGRKNHLPGRMTGVLNLPGRQLLRMRRLLGVQSYLLRV